MITKTSLQAIKALVFLAKLPKGEFVGAANIAKEIGAAQNYLGKVLQRLCAGGILFSQKGMGGGFRLNRDAHKITLFDVVNSIEDLSGTMECFFGLKKCCETSKCNIHARWKKVCESQMKFLTSTTIFELRLT